MSSPLHVVVVVVFLTKYYMSTMLTSNLGSDKPRSQDFPPFFILDFVSDTK